MLVVFIRTVIIYTVVVIVMRIMGKRQIGKFEPYELVVAIMIADLAAIPLEDKAIPLLNGLVPIFTLLFIQVSISFINMKSLWFRAFMDGDPSIVIQNGKIRIDELEKARFNVNELLEQLRIQGYPNIADIEFAILETSGNLSVVPKSQKRAVIPEDLGIETNYEGLPIPLILDGKVQYDNLSEAKLTIQWLRSELEKQNVSDLKRVFLASIDTDGNLFYQTRKEN